MASFEFMSIIICILMFFALSPIDAMVDFNQSYYPLWGQNHITYINQSNEVQLLLDKSSGGAGFKSKIQYESGLFTLRIKMPAKKTNGVITAFYLISDDQDAGVNHDEIDFEFIGTEGRLQTNIFANDRGGREQVFQLPFDPSEDFHTYQILYTPQRIVFFVDNIPIRSFKNNTKRGINFPTKSLWAEASLWISDSVVWAGAVDWGYAPFIVSFQDFNISGCPAGSNCLPSPDFSPWTSPKLGPKQLKLMRNFRKKHMTFDYCRSKGSKHRYPECA